MVPNLVVMVLNMGVAEEAAEIMVEAMAVRREVVQYLEREEAVEGHVLALVV